METLAQFLAMGGYARFVWPAFAVAVAVLRLDARSGQRRRLRAARRRELDGARARRGAMTRKRRRLYLRARRHGDARRSPAALVLAAFRDNLVFFYSPSELAPSTCRTGRLLRLGGLVEDGSVAREADGRTVDFRVTDLATGRRGRPIAASLPDLFREGQGVVAEGALARDGTLPRRPGAGQARRELHAAGGRRGAEEIRAVAGRRSRRRQAMSAR